MSRFKSRILSSIAMSFLNWSVVSAEQLTEKSVSTILISSSEGPKGYDPVGFLMQSGRFPVKHDFKITVQWLKSGAIERIEPESLLQGDQFRLNGDGPEPGVFALEKDRYLVWGPKGWAWVPEQTPWAFTAFATEIDQAISKANDELKKQTNSEGWTLHRGWLLEVNPATVKIQATTASNLLTASFPSMKEGEAHFESHGKYLAEGEPTPGLKELAWDTQPKTRPAVLALPIERKGDWVMVILPTPTSPAIKTLFWGVPGDDDPGLLVQWNPKATGWIHWRSEGTLQGTHLLLKGLGYSYWGFQ